MTTSTDSIRRHRLGMVALLTVVIPPREASRDRTRSEHVVAPNVLIRRLVNAQGERVYRVIVRGALVMHLTDKGDAAPIGYSLAGDWVAVMTTVAAPWLAPAGHSAVPELARPRRTPSRLTCHGARAPSAPGPWVGPHLVRVLAEYAASLGTSSRRDLDTITLGIGSLEFQVRLVRLEAEVLVLANRGGRLRLSGLLSRRDPNGPARMTSCIGSRWLGEPMQDLREHASLVDPADLLKFCRYER